MIAPILSSRTAGPEGQTARRAERHAQGDSTYGAPFWFAYAAQTSLMVAVSLLFRYADFVKLLGGTELHLGWIVGVGMTGAVVMRLALGVGIDRYGPRELFLMSVGLFITSCLGHLLVERVDGPLIYLLRIGYTTSLAGAFGASIAHISGRAPLGRVAEVVGTLGTSGFVGMVAGTFLGDLLFPATGPIEHWHLMRMFLVASMIGMAGLALGWLSLRGHAHLGRRRSLPLWRSIRQYHPGPVLVVGVAAGVGVNMPQIFLRTFAAETQIPNLASFFLIYCLVAFAARISTRGLPARLGIRPMILVGLGTLAVSMLAYLPVSREWHLVLPALFGGVAHALLFPSVVGGGSVHFPHRFRGLGTALMLCCFDFGNLIGSPLIGSIVHVAQWAGLPAYATMFSTLALLTAGVGAYFAYFGDGRPLDGQAHRRRRRQKLGLRRTGRNRLRDRAAAPRSAA